MTPRTLRIVAVSYLVKTLLIGIVWLAVPDFPQRVLTLLRATLSADSEGDR